MMSKEDTRVELNKESKVLLLKALRDGYFHTDKLAKALNIVVAKSQVTIFELPNNQRDDKRE